MPSPVTVEDVVVPALAVAGSWVLLMALVAGIGHALRRALFRLVAADASSPLRVDLWVGFAALLVYLELWSLAGGIGRAALIAPTAVGAAGIVWRVGQLRPPPRTRSMLAVAGATALGVLWLANRALGTATDYDFGLYHLGIMAYASSYGTVPGLGNLHDRLGAGNAHLLFAALLGRGPWSTAGYQIVNGFLVTLLVFDISSRFGRPGAWRALSSSFTQRSAFLLCPATLIALGAPTNYRLNSPNLDLATYVLVAVGCLYLAECVEFGYAPGPVAAATGSLAAAAVTRPLFWLPSLLAAGIVCVGRRRNALQTLAIAGLLPAALAAGWMARQTILTGYPLYPSTLAGLDVEWRMPAAAVHQMNDVVSAWARLPNRSPAEVLSSWSWLGHWLGQRKTDVDLAAPLVLLAVAAPALAATTPGAAIARRSRLSPMAAVVVCAATTLVAWFFVAPDPRFALAPLWLVPVAVAAWALPPTDELRVPAPRDLWRWLVPLVALAAALVGLLEWASLVAPAAVLAIAAAAALCRRLDRPWLPDPTTVALAAPVAAAVAFAVFVGVHGSFDPVVADGAGALGTTPIPTPRVVPFVTASGLRLVHPADGNDRCYRLLACTPEPNRLLRLRGKGLAAGFLTPPPSAGTSFRAAARRRAARRFARPTAARDR